MQSGDKNCNYIDRLNLSIYVNNYSKKTVEEFRNVLIFFFFQKLLNHRGKKIGKFAISLNINCVLRKVYNNVFKKLSIINIFRKNPQKDGIYNWLNGKNLTVVLIARHMNLRE